MTKAVIGFIGEMLAGKDTAERFLKAHLAKEMPGATQTKHRFSKILEETLNFFKVPEIGIFTNEAVATQVLLDWNIPPTDEAIKAVVGIMDDFRSHRGGRTSDPHARENMQFLSMDMDSRVLPGALSLAAGKCLAEDQSDIAMMNGLRWDSDIKMLFSVPDRVPILIGIIASEEARYKRALLRKEKTDEANITLDEFRRLSSKFTEVNIPRLLSAHSTLIFRNEGLDEESEKILDAAMHGAAVFIREYLSRKPARPANCPSCCLGR